MKATTTIIIVSSTCSPTNKQYTTYALCAFNTFIKTYPMKIEKRTETHTHTHIHYAICHRRSHTPISHTLSCNVYMCMHWLTDSILWAHNDNNTPMKNPTVVVRMRNTEKIFTHHKMFGGKKSVYNIASAFENIHIRG